jgi:hypothetical protein
MRLPGRALFQGPERVAADRDVSELVTKRQDLEAVVGDDVPGDGHPGFMLVSSNVVPVTWWQFVVFRGSIAHEWPATGKPSD